MTIIVTRFFDETFWQKCRSPIFPRRTVDGGWTSMLGQTWKQFVDGRWQYRQDQETDDEYNARQW